MNKIKRLLSAVLAGIMIASSAIVVSAAQVPFTDVSNHWAWTNGQIPYLTEKNVLAGYKQDNGTYMFKPDGQVKRAEFIKMLTETFGLKATADISYRDVEPDDWFYPYYQKAVAQGFILNYGTSGYPNGYITREEATALLVRYLDLPKGYMAAPSTFVDSAKISYNYKNYVLQAVYAGIINGYVEDDGTYFKPQKTLSRAEALTILYKAAGCIYDKSVSSRENGAHSTNNTITDGGITISNVTFNGRNIITEGASSGKITFVKCVFNDDVYIRGAAEVTFNDCEVGNVYASGGGRITLTNDTVVDLVYLDKTANISVHNGTRLNELEVRQNAKNVKVSGDGALGKVYILASGFNSVMMPEEYEIGNNLTAGFANESYSGDSFSQYSFEVEPFVTLFEGNYYVNAGMSESGKLYYYFTDTYTTPTTDGYTSYYESANYAGNIPVEKGEFVSSSAFDAEDVKDYGYVVLQLKDGNRKYAPVVVDNSPKSETGFSTDPYLAGTLSVKFTTSNAGTLYWFYTDDGNPVNQLDFLKQYNEKESALKGTVKVSANKTFSCELKRSYIENYSYVAFMLVDNNNGYYKVTTVCVGNTGFSTSPTVSTPGTVKYTANVTGKIYYFLSETDKIPTADKFYSEYKGAKSQLKDTVNIQMISGATFDYDTDYAEDYPYMIMAIKTSTGDWLPGVVLYVNYSTGFKNEPTLESGTEISYRADQSGTIKYYYTDEEDAPTVEEFLAAYNDTLAKYKKSSTAGTTYGSISVNASYAKKYPYIAIMLSDRSGNNFCPVVVKLDIASQLGFTTTPHVVDGDVTFRTQEDGDVWFYYTKNSSSVSSEEFRAEWDSVSSTRRDVISADSSSDASFELDTDLYRAGYKYIVFAFCDDPNEEVFSIPFVLDLSSESIENIGNGINIDFELLRIKVTAVTGGTVYWYTTDKLDKVANTSSDFEDEYAAAADAYKDYDYLSKNSYLRFYADTDDLKQYMVFCFYTDGEYLEPVAVDLDSFEFVEGTGGSDDEDEEDTSDKFDDGSTVTGSGFAYTFFDAKNDQILVVPNYNGTVEFFSVINGKTKIPHATQTVTAQEDVAFPVTLDTFVSGFLSYNTDIYVQLTSENGVHEAVLIITIAGN